MNKTKLIAIGILGIILIFLIISIFQIQKSTETINIGIILPLTGPATYYGEQARKGIEIAKEEILLQYPKLKLEIYYEDSQYKPKEGVDAYNKLKNINQIDAVITAASQVSLPIQPIAKQDGILQMAIFSSAEKYSSFNDISFRVSTRNDLEVDILTEFVKNKEFKNLAVIYIENDYGIGFKEALKKKLKEKNMDITIKEFAYSLDTTDFRTILTKIRESNNDAIQLVGLASQYVLVLNQAKEMGVNTQFIGSRSTEDPVLIKNAGINAEGIIYSYPFNAKGKNKETESFVNRFLENYNIIPDAYAAEGYEGFRLVATAFNKCGKDYPCIKSYLEDLKNYDSVFGILSFDDNGDVYYGYFLKIVKNGKFELYTY